MTPPVALTIAGSDSGGGAGIQADLRTFGAFGVFGTSAITAVTAQNTVGVQQVALLDPEIIRSQIISVTSDFDVRCVKTGMLGTAAVVDLIQNLAESHLFAKLVVDPVMVATTGARLISEDARDSYLRLLPFIDLITPNLYETEYLLQTKVMNIQDMQEAARRLCDLGARSALVKGGHREGAYAIDVFYDGTTVKLFQQPKIDTCNVHGTGCTLSAAIAAALALGESTVTAIDLAKRYVSSCIAGAVDWKLGSGSGPVNHLAHFDIEAH
ncbi:MAG TPA: bifunctional hydroxymethylpyrimidine kinase/phosphomethylpyrimidine kinase [Acidimicrobiales bacterium]|nr:bifunctional hydroxymethylpyrimidine kinase/phosphomethylpyrimidine kinase [Acidimicrobiales bacterium]